MFFMSLASAGAIIAQQNYSITTGGNFEWNQPGFYCDIQGTTTLKTNSSAMFTFIHPVYGDISSEKKVAEMLIANNGWTANTSTDTIVEGIVLFNKTGRMQINHSIFGYGAKASSGITLPYWSFVSTQCNHHSGRSIQTTYAVCDILGITPPSMRRISPRDHSIFEYWSVALNKWVGVDPDPGTTVYKYSDGNRWLSIEELFNYPEALLNTASPAVYTGTNNHHSFTELRIKDYEFWNRVIQNTGAFSNAWIDSPSRREDLREMVFSIDEGMEIDLSLQSVRKIRLDSTGFSQVFALCHQGYTQGDLVLMDSCVAGLAAQNNMTPDQMWNIIEDDSLDIILDNDTSVTSYKTGPEFLTVRLDTGLNTFSIPLVLRSIDIENEGADVSVGGITYDSNYFHKVYLPVMADANLLPTHDSLMKGVVDAYIPADAGEVTLTFYVNYEMFDFLEEEHEILVFSGNLNMVQTSTSTDLVIDPVIASVSSYEVTTITPFPNPTQGQVYFTSEVQEVQVFDALGQQQATNMPFIGNSVSNVDLSGLQNGMYFVRYRNPITGKHGVAKVYKMQ